MADAWTLESPDCELDWASFFSELEVPEARPVLVPTARATPYPPSQHKPELHAIRTQAEELERRIAQQQNDVREELQSPEQTQDVWAWQIEWGSVDQEHEQERPKAQEENETLRALIHDQQRDGQRILQLLGSAASMESVVPPLVSFAQYRGPEEDPQVHLLRLAELEIQASSVFARHAFQYPTKPRFCHVQLCELDASRERVELEVELSWLLPFCVDDVARALWVETTRMANNDKSIEFLHLYDSESEMVSQFISTPHHNEATPLNHGQVATPRLPKNPSDESILLVSNNAANVFSGGIYGGSLDESEWIRVEPAQTGENRLCRVKWYRRVSIRPPESNELTINERALWTHAVVSSPMRTRIEKSLERNIQRVENWLLAYA